MSQEEVLRLIEGLLGTIASSKGLKTPRINADTQLLGGEVGIDSLDLASLVHQLEEATGRDPFHSGFVNFQTAGELAKLYQQ